MRIALHGHGRWGTSIERTLKGFTDVTCVVIPKGQFAPDDIDGVIIATPISSHSEIALPYIEKGIPVFIEKPVTDSVADAERLIAAATNSDSLVQVGHIHLHNPAFLKAKEIVPTLGPIRYMLFEGMNNGPFRNDSSVLWDWLPHPLSMALTYMNANPISVQAWGINTLRPEVPMLYDLGFVKFDFGSASLVCTVNWLSPEKRTRMTIVGEKSSLVHDATIPQKLTLYEGMGPVVESAKVIHSVPQITNPEFESTMPLDAELRAFVSAIQEKSHDRSGLVFGTEIIRLIAAAHESVKKDGKRIRV